MNLQQSPTSTVERPGARNGSETRLHGRWLVLARVGWIAVTVTLVILNLIALPDTYGAHFTFTPQVLQDLHRLGLSPTLYSILLTVENAPFQLVYLALGLLLFLRRSDDRMALFCAFALVTFGNALPFYDFTNGSLVPSLATNAVLRVVALVLFAIGEASLVLFFYLFPSGRFAPRWTRWGALLVAAYWLAVIFFPALPSNAGGPATFLVPFFLLTAAVAQVYRYRRVSTPRERQQTKWVVFGLALAMLVLVVYIPIGFLLTPSIQNDPVLGNLNPVFEVALLLIAIFLVSRHCRFALSAVGHRHADQSHAGLRPADHAAGGALCGPHYWPGKPGGGDYQAGFTAAGGAGRFHAGHLCPVPAPAPSHPEYH